MKKRNDSDVFDDKRIKVPFVLPEITNEDKKAILSILNQNLLTDGPKLKEFEKKLRTMRQELERVKLSYENKAGKSPEAKQVT